MWTREDFQARLWPLGNDLDQSCIGMIHLPALPGAPAHGGDLGAVMAMAAADLAALTAGGVRAG